MASTPIIAEEVSGQEKIGNKDNAGSSPSGSQDVSIPDAVVKEEFSKSTVKFHVIACWVGITLNLLWFASDYFVLPEHWSDFLAWRGAVSMISMVVLLMRKKINFSIYGCMFILVLGISIQNAYMWSVMDEEHMKQHTFAYIALFIGVGMLVLWEIWYSVILMTLTIIANLIFYSLFQTNPEMTMAKFLIDGGMLTFSVGIFCMFLIRSRYRLTVNEIRSRLELAKSKEIIEKERNVVIDQKHEIEQQKDQLAEINKEITDSINYAKRIQSAFIPKEEEFVKHFRDSFVLFRPKDIVSGDFYWLHEHHNKVFYATADCTGHGVPGGFMTMLGLSFLEEIVEIKGETRVNEILNYLRDRIVTTLKQTGSVGENKDGMDIAIVCIDKTNKLLTYSAANNSVYICRDGELLELKPDKQPCGFYHEPKPFSSKEFQLRENDVVFTFTDGYADQFGGPKGKKYKYKNLENMLVQNFRRPCQEQKQELNDAITAWMGKEHQQVDDILVIGVRA